LLSQIISPTESDSLIAGRVAHFIFDTKVPALHSLSVSLGYSRSWFWLFRDSPTGNFEWQIPLQDVDSVSFSYHSLRFNPPEKIYEAQFAHSSEVTSIDFAGNDYLFLTSGLDGKIFIWDLQSRAKIDSLDLSPSKIYNAKFWGNSNRVVFSRDTALMIWDRSSRDIRTISSKTGIIRAIAVNSAMQLIAFGSYDGDFEVLDSNLNIVFSYRNDTQIYSTEFSFDGSLVAFGDYNGIAYVFNLLNGGKVFSLNTSYNGNIKNVIWSLDFSDNDDSLFATAGIDGKVRIWELKSGSLIDSFPNHLFHIRKVFFSKRDQVLTSASLDSSLRQIYYPRKFEIHPPLKEKSSIISLGFSGDKKYFVVGLRNGSVSIWKNYEIEELQQKLTLPYFIPMVAKSISFEIFPNEVKYVPLLVQNPLQVELKEFLSDSSFAIMHIPFEHFGVLDNDLNRFVVKRSDTVYSQLDNIRFTDTFAVLYIWSFAPMEQWGKFYLEQINFRGKRNLLWTFQMDSILVVERCKPLTGINRFELVAGLDFEFFPNPVQNKIHLKIFGDNNSFVNIKLVDYLGREVKFLFKGIIQNRVTEFEVMVDDVASGAYSLVMEYNGQKVAKKLVILR
jgi:WD40 repeat protein